MFEHIPATQPDPILALMQMFKTDDRDGKVDLGVGVYKDGSGKTPVMRAVRSAEQKLHDSQETKTYVSPTGDLNFCEAIMDMVLGADRAKDRQRALQTPGGSGALKVIADLLAVSSPDVKTWTSDPTWPNHLPLLKFAGHDLVEYPYYDSATQQLDFDAMMNALQGAKAGDIVLLHGCCHNPTGADPSAEQWHQIADLLLEKNLFAFVDMAYQGFADGLEQDAEGVRILASKLPEMAIATSCSKNLALYRDRVGAAILVAQDETAVSNTLSKATSMVRQNYSMPPDHGAALTQMILTDKTLRQEWQEELESMRVRMETQRSRFADALRKRSNSDRFDFVARQKGMFSRLPLTTEQVNALREEHGIYMVGDGRINVAGLPEEGLDKLAGHIVDCMDG